MHGFAGSASGSLIEAITDVIDQRPYVRRAEFGDAGLITYLINDGADYYSCCFRSVTALQLSVAHESSGAATYRHFL
jgi:hypothetical protein